MKNERFADAVGAYVRAQRAVHGITLEDVARAGRKYGATWSLSSIQSIEAGKSSPTLPTLLILALALGELTGVPLRLADLFSEIETLNPPHFGGGEPIDRQWLERVLDGGVVRPEPQGAGREHAEALPFPAVTERVFEDDLDVAVLVDGARPLVVEDQRRYLAALLDESQDPERGIVSSEPALAVRRAAGRLGIAPGELEQQAVRLWSRTFDSEVRSRAGVGSSPQARGRVTRLLVEELRTALEER